MRATFHFFNLGSHLLRYTIRKCINTISKSSKYSSNTFNF
nr:MAG TPA: hypothetical protein [Bacteriophage sp.]